MNINPNIKRLYQICQKTEKQIIGLMSGTSLDGLDVALCRFKGSGRETEVKLLNFHTVEYSEEEKTEIRKVFGKCEIDFQQLCILNPWIGNLHGEMVLQCLKIWGLEIDDVDIIASHGQTVFHAPQSFHGVENYGNSTLQIGDGDHIAVKTGIITISDFRQKQIAAGGEGAPLAIYGDVLLFSKAGEDRILLNIGGIANFTYLSGNSNLRMGRMATDTGPGNTLLDAFAREMFGKSYDKDGGFAKAGSVNESLLQGLKRHDFFKLHCPKTTGPELFNTEYVKVALKNTSTENISPFDLMATLTRFTVETIVETIQKTIPCQDVVQNGRKTEASESQNCKHIYISGGGSHNVFLVNQLKEMLTEFSVNSMNVLGISGDAKEAVLFATLANECLSGTGKYNDGASSKDSLLDVSMGKISFPL